MQANYSSAPRHSNTFIAEQRDRLNDAEMTEARQLDAAEPATHKAWRKMLELNGQLRVAIQLLRIARENCGKGYRRVEVYPGIVPGWFESRKWTQEFTDECQANVLWFLADRKTAWAAMRRVEAVS